MSAVPILWLHDPTVGDGKSGIGWELFAQTVENGVKTAYIDLEYVGAFAPAPHDDPGNHRLKLRLLAALWPAYQADGVGCLVVFTATGVVQVGAALRDAIPSAVVTTCRTDDAGTAEAVPRDAEADVHIIATGREDDEVAARIRTAAGNWPFRDLEP